MQKIIFVLCLLSLLTTLLVGLTNFDRSPIRHHTAIVLLTLTAILLFLDNQPYYGVWCLIALMFWLARGIFVPDSIWPQGEDDNK